MEPPDDMERKVSFNPEAATFSPVAIAAKPAGAPAATPDASTNVARRFHHYRIQEEVD